MEAKTAGYSVRRPPHIGVTMDSLTTKIVDRLKRYTDHEHDTAHEIARQVMIALDIDDSLDPIVMSEYEFETEIDRQANRAAKYAHREGYMQALEDVRYLVIKRYSVDQEKIDSLATIYLDNHV
jgi:hypothetical protein